MKTLAPKVSVALAIFAASCGAALQIANSTGRLQNFKWAIIPLFAIAGIALLYAVWAIISARFNEDKSPPLPVTQHNQQHVIASPQQIVNIGLDIPRVHSPLPIPATTSQKQEVTPAEYPEIEILEARYYRLSEFFPNNFGAETVMMVVPFRNKSTIGQQVPFSAHITYKSGEREIANVERGDWFPTQKSSIITTFPTLKTRNLAVFFLRESELFNPVINWLHHAGSGLSIRMPEPTHKKFPEKISTIEITLLFGDKSPKFVFRVEYAEGKSPSLVKQAV